MVEIMVLLLTETMIMIIREPALQMRMIIRETGSQMIMIYVVVNSLTKNLSEHLSEHFEDYLISRLNDKYITKKAKVFLKNGV